jgi:hypothetical protein
MELMLFFLFVIIHVQGKYVFVAKKELLKCTRGNASKIPLVLNLGTGCKLDTPAAAPSQNILHQLDQSRLRGPRSWSGRAGEMLLF